MLRVLLAVSLLSLPSFSAAQEAPGPAPARGEEKGRGSEMDLLPALGRIGAEVAAFGGASFNPFDAGRGFELGGYADLPLRRFGGVSLSYELFLGFSSSTSDPFPITLAGGSVQTQLKLRALHLSPAGFKFFFSHGAVRPFFTVGADAIVAATQPTHGAPTEAPELLARGVPNSQAGILVGGHASGGLEFFVASGVSLNAEYRIAATDGTKGRLSLVDLALAIHW